MPNPMRDTPAAELLRRIRESGATKRADFLAWHRDTYEPLGVNTLLRILGASSWTEARRMADRGEVVRDDVGRVDLREQPISVREDKRSLRVDVPSVTIAPDPWGRNVEPEPEAKPSMKRRLPTGETLLIIPDAHAHPEHDNDRFDRLGRYVAAERPDYIVCLGDWFEMAAVNTHASARDKEGHRVRADLECGWDAMRRFVAPWWESDYTPKRAVFCLGNHEARLENLAAMMPEWAGAVPDLRYLTEGLRSFGWEVHPFKAIVNVCGYAVSHFLPSGVMGRAVGGVNQARSLIQHGKESAIVGHSHTYGHHVETSYLDRKIQGIVAGCYVHPDMVEGWNRQTAAMWARGVVKVTLLAPGYGDVQFVSAERLA